MKRHTLQVCLLTAATAYLMGMSYDEGQAATRFPSPRGKFDVAIEPSPPYVSLDPDKPAPAQGLKSVQHQISFYLPGQQTPPVAVTWYYDIYASSPTPARDLMKAILWSPAEDIAILPAENWPSASGHARSRTAVSLNTSIPWQTTPFLLDDNPLIWIDPLTVAGNWTDGCQLSVGEFDGKTGKTTAVAETETPFGYKITGSEGAKVFMKKVPGPCATPAQAKQLAPECLTLDLTFMRREVTPCK